MPIRIIISGGGTGGHIYPGIAIAEELQQRDPRNKILFVGAQGKMEMERVPKAGFKIIGLPIRGLERRLAMNNFKLPFLLAESLWKSRQIINTFRPDVVLGTGGYASAAIGWVAARKNIPLVLQEQNNYAGLTNRWLASSAKHICVAYPHMENHFPKEKIQLTGNPLRKNLKLQSTDQVAAYEHFGFDPNKKTILVMGGSGGARTINRALALGIERILEAGYQVIWQTGSYYQKWVNSRIMGIQDPGLYVQAFIEEMDKAYACADMVVCRAGALTVSEISLLGLPAILIPSPHVTDDHQTKNATGLAQAEAALMIRDEEAAESLTRHILALAQDTEKQEKFRQNILKFAYPNARTDIADLLEHLATKKKPAPEFA